MFGAVNTLRRACVAVSHELVGGQSWPPMQSCEVQIAARPSDESFRLLVLDPDAKIHTFVCFVAQLARVGQLGWILQALGFLFEQLGIGQLGIETWKLISSGSWGWVFTVLCSQLATKVKCYKAYVLPILLFGSECWSLTKVQSQKLERVHSSCLRSILGVRLSDRHTNEHIRKSCGVATLSAYITANRLRWLGHVGRMEEGRLPHIALFSSLHGDMTRPVGRPRHTWEKCVCADLKVLGQDEGSWEASCQITNYQLPNGPVKAGRRWGQRHPQGANFGSNGIHNFMSKLKQWLPPAHPKSLASQCMSGQPISTCHVLTS